MTDINTTLAAMAIQPLQLQVSEHDYDDLGMQENGGSMDKEMLRKVKRKERTKQNRRRKKSLQKNLSQVTAANLQQSVAALATTIGGTSLSHMNDGASSCYEQHVISGISALQPSSSPHAVAVNIAPDERRPAQQTAVCVMDSSNFNERLNHEDLSRINDYIEKCLFRDLLNISKLKIANSYLSTSKRVWIICHSTYTALWVTRRVAEMPVSNGRKFTAKILSEMEVMTQVNVLVPKECTMIQGYDDLMRCLTAQNPGLGLGTTIPVPKRGAGNKPTEGAQESDVPSEVNGLNKPDEVHVEGSVDSFQDGIPTSTIPRVSELASSPAVKLTSMSPGKGFSVMEEEKPQPLLTPRQKTFSLYADDKWLNELRSLSYRPYVGVRRLLCVVGERLVQRPSHHQGPARKKRRERKRLRSTRGDAEAGEQDSCDLAATDSHIEHNPIPSLAWDNSQGYASHGPLDCDPTN